ncbi:hypothetical protein [Paenibacillus paeoniae]|uniref:Uncharacterized protein n=1 Tax=Paenibacillus paeoniae TaxID=2292705 RepID=A0A371PKT8_9BACL|nr:hypothetical protein [Paenibacillus paeoniae]REK76814.1 hypothetical protein DX130_07220 [Paenibacillus paeoniae]
MSYPIDIEQFHQTVLKLKGITEVESGVENLEPIEADLLGYSACAHLPHAALLRTGGGLESEVLLQFEIRFDYSPESLLSVEFLAWFVRDCARGGTKVQLRPFALPPESPLGRQLGTTLKWHLDLFVDGIEETLDPAFETVRRLNHSLQTAIRLYHIPVK